MGEVDFDAMRDATDVAVSVLTAEQARGSKEDDKEDDNIRRAMVASRRPDSTALLGIRLGIGLGIGFGFGFGFGLGLGLAHPFFHRSTG